MSTFGGIILTNRGRNLQSKAQTGVELEYTKIGVGDGELGSTSIIGLNRLINEVKALDIIKLRAHGNGEAVVGAVISNQDMDRGFYFREVGVYANDPDLGEILYCYGNAGDLAEYISPGDGSDIIEKSIDVQMAVGNAENITAVIDSSLIYATQKDIERLELKMEEHEEQRGVPEGYASLDEKGNVPQEQLGNFPDSTWDNIKKKPETFPPSSHKHSISDVTDLQTELNKKETPSEAQKKATKAKDDAIEWAKGFGLGSPANITDFNGLDNGFYYAEPGADNAPNASGYFVVFVSKKASNAGSQMAIQRFSNGDSKAYIRGVWSGNYGDWIELETTDGAQKKIDEHANKTNNPHKVTKTHVGLGNVINEKQASEASFNVHKEDNNIHVTKEKQEGWNSKQDALPEERTRKITFGVGEPTGGEHGNIYFQYEDEEVEE